MTDYREDDWLRDVTLVIVGWLVALTVAGLGLVVFGGMFFG